PPSRGAGAREVGRMPVVEDVMEAPPAVRAPRFMFGRLRQLSERAWDIRSIPLRTSALTIES
ncbi:MAG: hypothetical protein WKH68_05055, partial [Candidatus Limnocylindria bacterium]